MNSSNPQKHLYVLLVVEPSFFPSRPDAPFGCCGLLAAGIAKRTMRSRITLSDCDSGRFNTDNHGFAARWMRGFVIAARWMRGMVVAIATRTTCKSICWSAAIFSGDCPAEDRDFASFTKFCISCIRNDTAWCVSPTTAPISSCVQPSRWSNTLTLTYVLLLDSDSNI